MAKKKKLVSDTERVALESGTVGFEGSLLNGKPDWETLRNIPDATLTDEEQAFLDGPVEEFCKMLDDWEIVNSEEQDMPKEAWDFAKSNGMLGLVIPKEYGGKGFSALMHSAVVQKIASRSFSAAVNVMVPNSLGPGELLSHYGTDEQKKKWLPKLASGEVVPCFGLTEPKAGSDATTLNTKGIVKKGEDGEPYIHIPNLDKRYITLAPIANLLGVAFDLEDPDNLLGKGEHPGITLALVPDDTEGLEPRTRFNPMDAAFNNGTIKGDIKIAPDAIIGGADQAGEGWRLLMEALSIGRSISLPSVSTSANKSAAYYVGAYSRIRQQFGLDIGKFEGIEEPMARIAGYAYLAEATRVATARMVDQGLKPVIPSAIAKYHMTENMRQAITDAMDILGGKGVMSGPNNPINRVYTAIPIAITVEGANILTRNMMIFGQGGVRSHDHMVDILDAMENGKYLKLGMKGMKMVMDTIVRGVQGLGPDFLHGGKIGDVDPQMKKFYKHINRMSASFNFAANVSYLTLQTKLKFKERLSARLGDVFSHLYMASATLNKFEQDGRPDEDRVIVEWVMHHCFDESNKALKELTKNFPGVMGGVLKAGLAPVLMTDWHPSDKLEHKVAQTILKPGDVRDRLTTGIFKPTDENDSLSMFERAFVAKANAMEQLREAKKNGEEITPELQALLEEVEELCQQVIDVDEFDMDKTTLVRPAVKPKP